MLDAACGEIICGMNSDRFFGGAEAWRNAGGVQEHDAEKSCNFSDNTVRKNNYLWCNLSVEIIAFALSALELTYKFSRTCGA